MNNFLNKLKANLVFSIDTKSYFKSLWIGCLLITWFNDSPNDEWYYTEFDFNWYGLDFWLPQEIDDLVQ